MLSAVSANVQTGMRQSQVGLLQDDQALHSGHREHLGAAFVLEC